MTGTSMSLFWAVGILIVSNAVRAQDAPCQACYGGSQVDVTEGVCLHLQQVMRETFAATTRECTAAQLTMYQGGCCPDPPEGFCTICPEGGDYNPEKEVPGLLFDFDVPITCEQLETSTPLAYGVEAFEAGASAGTCDDTFMRSSAAWCECNTAQVECTLCEGGARPTLLNRKENFLMLVDCASLEYVATMMNATTCPKFADEVLSFDAPAFCGCPNATSPELCGVCPDGYHIRDQDLVVGLEESLGHNPTCGHIDEAVRHIPHGSVCANYRQTFDYSGVAAYCCEQTPLEGCNLCPGGDFQADKAIPGLFYSFGDDVIDSITCDEFQTFEMAALTDRMYGGDITQCSDTHLEKSSAWCGCDTAPKSCTLCPDGSTPTDLDKMEKVFFGFDCATFEYTSTFLSEDECPNLVLDLLHFDAPAFCKCPGTEPPGVCDLCPEGMKFRNPNSLLPQDDSGLTCGDLENSMTFISTEEACTATRERVHQYESDIRLCCEEVNDYEALPSSPQDNGAPSTSDGSATDGSTTAEGNVIAESSAYGRFGNVEVISTLALVTLLAKVSFLD